MTTTDDRSPRIPSPDETPSTPLDPILSKTFGLLSAVRRRRIFHPKGRYFEGSLKLFPDRAPQGAQLFADAGPHDVIARLSRAAGLPEPLPDVLGLSVKIPDAYGPGHDQDFLLATCLPPPLGHHVLAPATGWRGRSFSSVLPYRVGDERLVIGVVPEQRVDVEGTGSEEVDEAAREGVLQYRFSVASAFGGWRTVGVLYLEDRAEEAEVSFDPWNTGEGLQPTGLVNKLRPAAYRGSRGGRPHD